MITSREDISAFSTTCKMGNDLKRKVKSSKNSLNLTGQLNFSLIKIPFTFPANGNWTQMMVTPFEYWEEGHT